ncbi:hypothetical protein JIO05_05555 [Pediococcus acidilactici]|jgi:hypothetical protein|uniref:hypothetical protein n=1 Tax=Pediococcus acidilactici TaxID=1254 RepID=UPI00136743A2|nr:hypothetical protein [Pediococcus acidilactici]MCH4101043.1 hypothetical protein [Pediococcus acidilactici]MDB8873772.1 hypothetical protein [Pediococcus acidilactici]MDB8875700.1 hypothetical protein [Pediococcus acidilactici]QHM52782.1 hypothetical protein C7M41_01522 [Pediococcus acidilactici]QHM54835.1 hypothetical protein C7M42_01576 [Pediococcus acidilactici]
MHYFYKRCLQEFGILPKDLDEQNFYRLMEVVNAKKPEEQMADPMEIYKQNVQEGGE